MIHQTVQHNKSNCLAAHGSIYNELTSSTLAGQPNRPRNSVVALCSRSAKLNRGIISYGHELGSHQVLTAEKSDEKSAAHMVCQIGQHVRRAQR